MNIKEKIRQWVLWKIMNDDEKEIWLRREAQKLHIKGAEMCDFVGHSSDCCNRLLLKVKNNIDVK